MTRFIDNLYKIGGHGGDSRFLIGGLFCKEFHMALVALTGLNGSKSYVPLRAITYLNWRESLTLLLNQFSFSLQKSPDLSPILTRLMENLYKIGGHGGDSRFLICGLSCKEFHMPLVAQIVFNVSKSKTPLRH